MRQDSDVSVLKRSPILAEARHRQETSIDLQRAERRLKQRHKSIGDTDIFVAHYCIVRKNTLQLSEFEIWICSQSCRLCKRSVKHSEHRRWRTSRIDVRAEVDEAFCLNSVLRSDLTKLTTVCRQWNPMCRVHRFLTSIKAAKAPSTETTAAIWIACLAFCMEG